MKLNPFCDIVVIGSCVQFRLPTKVTTLEGQSVSKIVQRMLPVLGDTFKFRDLVQTLGEYQEKEIQDLLDELVRQNILGESFPDDILNEASFDEKLKPRIPDHLETDVNIGIVNTGNIALSLAEVLSICLPVSLFRIAEFDDGRNKSSLNSTNVQALPVPLAELAKGPRFDYLIFFPEGLGIADQKKLEKVLKEAKKTHLVTGFRKDAVYYAASVGSIVSVFLRIFRGLYLQEDLLLGKRISKSRNMISRTTYFGANAARWIASDLAVEIVSLIDERINSASLIDHVLIYDLPLLEKRTTRFIELPEKISRARIGLSIPRAQDLQVEEEEDLQQKLERLRERFVGEATVLPEVQTLRAPESSFTLPFYAYVSRYSSPNNLFEPQREPLLATGVSEHKDLAELKAIMEGIERYSSGIRDPTLLKLAKAIELDEEYILPSDIVAYHPNQYAHGLPLRPFAETEEFFWKKCFNLSQKKPVYVLADCVFYPFYLGERKGMKPYTFGNSSGVAARFSWDEAIRTAILELSERDAFVIVWLNKLSMPRVNANSLPKHLRQRIQAINSFGFEVHILDITMDLFPVILVVAVKEGSFPAFICGAASSVNVKEAAEKALTEVEIDLHTLHSPELSPKKIRDVAEVSFPSDHAALYYDPSNLERLKFLFQGSTEVTWESIVKKVETNETLEGVLSYLADKRLQVIVADLAPLDVRQLCPQIKVVRVIIPKLVPIYFGAYLEPLAVERLFVLPKELGLSNIVLCYEMIDRYPHPFP